MYVCRLNSRASSTFYVDGRHTSLALRNELHCNTRPRICSEPCKHLVLHATFEECRVESVRQGVVHTNPSETFSPAILHFRGSPYHDHLLLSHAPSDIAHALVSKSIDRSSERTFPFSRRSSRRTRDCSNLPSVTQYRTSGDNVRCNDICRLLTASSIEYLSSQMFQKVGCFDPSSIETLDTLRRGSGGSDNSSVSSSIPKKPVVGG